jgi:hypothetical protein
MAFKTFTAGEILTASDVNTYLMKQSVITCTSGTRPSSPTEGMIIYETDTDMVRVYSGAAWQEVALLNPPRCVVQREVTQSLTSGTTSAIIWDTEVTDSHTMWTVSPNPTRVVIPSGGDGIYLIGAAAEFAPHATGNRQIAVDVSGTTTVRQTIPSIGSGLGTRVNISYASQLSAGQYVEITARQDSGGALNLTTSENHPRCWVVRIAPAV